MTTREVSEVLGCSSRSIFRLVDAGRLTPVRLSAHRGDVSDSSPRRSRGSSSSRVNRGREFRRDFPRQAPLPGADGGDRCGRRGGGRASERTSRRSSARPGHAPLLARGRYRRGSAHPSRRPPSHALSFFPAAASRTSVCSHPLVAFSRGSAFASLRTVSYRRTTRGSATGKRPSQLPRSRGRARASTLPMRAPAD